VVSQRRSYNIGATAHLDLFNPDTGLGGLTGHVFVDGLWPRGSVLWRKHRSEPVPLLTAEIRRLQSELAPTATQVPRVLSSILRLGPLRSSNLAPCRSRLEAQLSRRARSNILKNVNRRSAGRRKHRLARAPEATAMPVGNANSPVAAMCSSKVENVRLPQAIPVDILTAASTAWLMEHGMSDALATRSESSAMAKRAKNLFIALHPKASCRLQCARRFKSSQAETRAT